MAQAVLVRVIPLGQADSGEAIANEKGKVCLELLK